MRPAIVLGAAFSAVLIIAASIVVPLSAFVAEEGCTTDDPCGATSDPAMLVILAVLALLGAIASLLLSISERLRYAAVTLGLTFLVYLAWGWVLYHSVNDNTF